MGRSQRSSDPGDRRLVGALRELCRRGGGHQLRLNETGDGTVNGTWDDVPVEGERLGGLVLYLAGKSPQRSHRMAARIRGDLLLASYTAHKSAGGRYIGWLAAGRRAATEVDAPRGVKFSGNWTGSYVNTKGQYGKEILNVNEDSNGDLTGIWTDDVRLGGERVGHDAIYLEGKAVARSYHLVGLAEDGRLLLHYAAHGPNPERYYGVSTLRPAQY